MDGKSQEWRDAADRLLEALARDNQYIVADMLIVFLESANYGLDDYAPLGGVFKRARDRGIIKRLPRSTRQALWVSNLYGKADPLDNVIDQLIYLEGFGSIDGKYVVESANSGRLSLRRSK